MAVFRGHEEIEEINMPDDPTEDVQTKTPEETPEEETPEEETPEEATPEENPEEETPKETPKSGLRLIKLVVLSFGLLHVITISLRLVSFNNLTHERVQFKRERDQLQTTLNNVTEERDALQKRLCEIDGWIRFGCSSYYVSTEGKTWNESRQDCQQRGADLVIINTREEQEFIHTLTRGRVIWIGLSDSAVEGNWTWVDGTPLTTAYWISGEPDNGVGGWGGEHDCAEISSYYPDPVTSWYDGPCGYPTYWICERGI